MMPYEINMDKGEKDWTQKERNALPLEWFSTPLNARSCTSINSFMVDVNTYKEASSGHLQVNKTQIIIAQFDIERTYLLEEMAI